jgi:hypothetical protein
MRKPEPIDPAATLVLPEDEIAARRKKQSAADTAELREMTVQEVERQLLGTDETRTDLHAVLEREESGE